MVPPLMNLFSSSIITLSICWYVRQFIKLSLLEFMYETKIERIGPDYFGTVKNKKFAPLI